MPQLGPTTSPVTTPIGTPVTFPQAFGTPTTVGQPTTSDPTPAIIPDITPTPTPTTDTQPGTQPEPEPGITPTITTVETPTPNQTPTPRRRRRRRGDRDDEPQRRVIPNPVADDPNRHPREVQYTEVIRHTVDLPTGEHTIEPLDDQALQTAQITAFGPQDPRGNVHRAGSVVIETEPNRVLLESATRRRDANLQDPGEAEVATPVSPAPGVEVAEGVPGNAATEQPVAPTEAGRFADPAAAVEAYNRRLIEERQQLARRPNLNLGRRIDEQQTSQRGGADAIAGVDLDAAHARYLEQQRQAEPAAARQEIRDIRRQDQAGAPAATNAGGFDFDAGLARAQTPPADYEEPPRDPEDLRRFHFDYVRVVGSQPSGDVQRDLATYREARRRSASQSASQPGSRSGPASPPSGRFSGGRPRSANNEAAGLMTGGGRGRPKGGGRRRRDDDEDEYKRPEITIVLEQ